MENSDKDLAQEMQSHNVGIHWELIQSNVGELFKQNQAPEADNCHYNEMKCKSITVLVVQWCRANQLYPAALFSWEHWTSKGPEAKTELVQPSSKPLPVAVMLF